MPTPAKVTEEELMQLYLSLPAGARRPSHMAAALRQKGVIIARQSVHERMQEWDIVERAAVQARDQTRQAVAAAVVEQMANLNDGQELLAGLIAKATALLDAHEPTSLKDVLTIVECAAKLMVADSKVRTDIAQIKANTPPPPPERKARSEEVTFDFQEILRQAEERKAAFQGAK
jgi:hypothetical protein